MHADADSVALDIEVIANERLREGKFKRALELISRVMGSIFSRRSDWTSHSDGFSGGSRMEIRKTNRPRSIIMDYERRGTFLRLKEE